MPTPKGIRRPKRLAREQAINQEVEDLLKAAQLARERDRVNNEINKLLDTVRIRREKQELVRQPRSSSRLRKEKTEEQIMAEADALIREANKRGFGLE
jgi:hypothetical protein